MTYGNGQRVQGVARRWLFAASLVMVGVVVGVGIDRVQRLVRQGKSVPADLLHYMEATERTTYWEAAFGPYNVYRSPKIADRADVTFTMRSLDKDDPTVVLECVKGRVHSIDVLNTSCGGGYVAEKNGSLWRQTWWALGGDRKSLDSFVDLDGDGIIDEFRFLGDVFTRNGPDRLIGKNGKGTGTRPAVEP